MFAGLLNKGLRGGLVLLILTFLISATFNYFSKVALETDNYPNLFYNYFTQNIRSKFVINFLNFLFIGIGVFLINLIAINQEIADKQNYFPVFLYLLLCVSSANPFQITPQIFTNVFILFSIYKLLDTYRKDKVFKQVFEAAFWLSACAFITVSSIICFPLFFVILFILRPFNWQEWAVAFIGFFMPPFIYECMAYLSDFNQWYMLNAMKVYFHSFKTPSFSEYYLALSFSLFMLMITSLFYNLKNGFGNTVKKQKAKTILLWFLVFSFFGFFAGGANSSNIILTYALPLSFFIGDLLYHIKQIKITNAVIAMLVFCVVIIFLGKMGMI